MKSSFAGLAILASLLLAIAGEARAQLPASDPAPLETARAWLDAAPGERAALFFGGKEGFAVDKRRDPYPGGVVAIAIEVPAK